MIESFASVTWNRQADDINEWKRMGEAFVLQKSQRMMMMMILCITSYFMLY